MLVKHIIYDNRSHITKKLTHCQNKSHYNEQISSLRVYL